MGSLWQSILELLTRGPDLIGGNCVPCRDTSEIPVIENEDCSIGWRIKLN